MNALVLCIRSDGRKASTDEFHRVASRCARKLGGVLEFVDDMWDVADALEARLPVQWDHVVFVGHGTPVWWGLPGKMGVHRYKEQSELIWSARSLATILRETCHPTCIVSFASCSSGASPRWYRTKLLGRVVAPWGAASHEDGGKLSLAGRVSSLTGLEVRAHTTSGHTTFNPAIRVFTGDTKGQSMAKKIIGQSWKNTRANRVDWNTAFKPWVYEDLLIGAST